MKALVTTPAYLLYVDLVTRVLIPIENHRSEYYGISWFPGQDDLVLSHSGVDNEKLTEIGEYAQSEIGWLSFGTGETQRFLSQPHQILCASDGRIVCTNTGRNCITVIEPTRLGHYQEARLSEARWDRLSIDTPSGEHLNSIFEYEKLLYVLCHGHRQGSRVGILSYPELEIVSIFDCGSRFGMHNLWITDQGQWIACDSENGSLVDLQSQNPLWKCHSPIFTRGLAASDDVLIVGESEKVSRSGRHNSIAALWIICRKTWKPLDYIFLGPFGSVHDVRLIDVPDYAHHGHPLIHEEFAKIIRVPLAKFSENRLSNAKIAFEHQSLWDDFLPVFGTPEIDITGWGQAPPGVCCFVTEKSQGELAFAYALQEPGVSHVSSVIGYQGKGDDSNMLAVLLQLESSERASLNIWMHDGNGWALVNKVDTAHIPAAGILRTKIHIASVSIFIDDQFIAEIESPNSGALDGSQGIRWFAARVRPCASSSE